MRVMHGVNLSKLTPKQLRDLEGAINTELRARGTETSNKIVKELEDAGWDVKFFTSKSGKQISIQAEHAKWKNCKIVTRVIKTTSSKQPIEFKYQHDHIASAYSVADLLEIIGNLKGNLEKMKEFLKEEELEVYEDAMHPGRMSGVCDFNGKTFDLSVHRNSYKGKNSWRFELRGESLGTSYWTLSGIPGEADVISSFSLDKVQGVLNGIVSKDNLADPRATPVVMASDKRGSGTYALDPVNKTCEVISSRYASRDEGMRYYCTGIIIDLGDKWKRLASRCKRFIRDHAR